MATSTSPERPIPPEIPDRLRALAARWSEAAPRERSNYQLYLIELAEALGVERPRPAAPITGGRVSEVDAYQFEYPVAVTTRDGRLVTNYIASGHESRCGDWRRRATGNLPPGPDSGGQL